MGAENSRSLDHFGPMFGGELLKPMSQHLLDSTLFRQHFCPGGWLVQMLLISFAAVCPAEVPAETAQCMISVLMARAFQLDLVRSTSLSDGQLDGVSLSGLG